MGGDLSGVGGGPSGDRARAEAGSSERLSPGRFHAAHGDGPGDGSELQPQRLVVVEPPAFAEATAAMIAEILEATVSAAGTARVALAGGSTPRPVYARLAAHDDLPWSRVHVYFGDERAVRPDDPESNFRMACATLLRPAAVPPAQIHRMPAERADRDTAAAAYACLLPQRFDLVLLGIGADGHVASLFPGAPALAERERRVLAVHGPDGAGGRLTITPPVITAARATLLMAAGHGKAAAVARALHPPYEPAACPAQLAAGGIWVLDREAAGELRSAPS